MTSACSVVEEAPSYQTTCSVAYCDELGSYRTYGITAMDHDGNIVAEIPDITVSSEEAAKITRMLNEGKVSLCHFRDVVLDFIASF